MANRGRVVLAMSGGVDSSVSAKLLVEQGYDVVGVFMRTGAHTSQNQTCDADDSLAKPNKIRGCCSALDAGDAQRVADRLNIPFYALNFEDEFNRIKDYFVDEYMEGRTPNPCVVCNTWLKFGKLIDYADAIGARFIATGHYAKVLRGADGPELHRGDDPSKDQSYFLFGLRRQVLDRLLFPIGSMQKAEVRQIAQQHQLGVHQKPDSQEICFVPSGDYLEFIQQHRPAVPDMSGDIVDQTGKVLGKHNGITRFTIGQRKGLGIAVGQPRYVLELKPEANQVVIGPQELLQRSELEAEKVNWLIPAMPASALRCEVKIRYLHNPTPAMVEPLDENRVRVVFDTPQSAVTPGQAVVFQSGTHILGGGWIC